MHEPISTNALKSVSFDRGDRCVLISNLSIVFFSWNSSFYDIHFLETTHTWESVPKNLDFIHYLAIGILVPK